MPEPNSTTSIIPNYLISQNYLQTNAAKPWSSTTFLDTTSVDTTVLARFLAFRLSLSLMICTPLTSTLIQPSSSATGMLLKPLQLAVMVRSALAPATPDRAVKKVFCSTQDSCGVTVTTESLPIEYLTLQPAATCACLVNAERSYCWSGHKVMGCVIVRVRPTTADLNCAIVPLPVGAGSEPSVMAGSRASIDHPGNDPSSCMPKLGLSTMLPGSAQAA